MNFSKYLGEVGLAELWNLMTSYMDGKMFIGTKEEYEAIASTIAPGTLVIITDEDDVEIPPTEEIPDQEPDRDFTVAILGAAILGQMILGRF